MVQKRDRLAGIALALVMLRPHIAIFLAVPLLLVRRRAWWWFCAASGLLALASLALVGWQGARDFMNILSQSASGHGYWAHEAEMHNLAGLLLRSGLPVGEAHLVSWGVWGLAMLPMAGWWRMRGGSPTPAQIGVAVALATFVAPHLQLHDVALLLAPVLLLTLEVVGQTGIKRDVAMLIPGWLP